MKKSNYLIGAIVFISLFSCSKELSVYYLESSTVGEGIHISMPVISEGVEIGSITNISIKQNKAIIEISLKKDFILCDSSKFFMSDMFDPQKTLKVSNQCLKRTIYEGDTLRMDLTTEIRGEHSSFTITKERIDSIKATYPLKKDTLRMIIK